MYDPNYPHVRTRADNTAHSFKVIGFVFAVCALLVSCIS